VRYKILADVVLLVHLCFVLFVGLGSVLALRWPKLAWVHLPALAWGVWIEFSGWICPLTPLEISLRQRGGEAGYEGGFIDHYVSAWMYPQGLTRTTQMTIGIVLCVVNTGIYGYLLYRRGRQRLRKQDASESRPG
jgi:Protein of Unknown function (DUF2784)